LKPGKATGPDGIGNSILSFCADVLSEPIAWLIDKSLEIGQFPTRWKTANVTPIYKKGDRQNPANYRPISLLSNTSKVMEKVVFEKLYHYITVNIFLSPNNLGFKEIMEQ